MQVWIFFAGRTDPLSEAYEQLQRPIRRLHRRQTWWRRNRYLYGLSEHPNRWVDVDKDGSYLNVGYQSTDRFGQPAPGTRGFRWTFACRDRNGGPFVQTIITLTLDEEGSPQLREGGRRYPGTRDGWSAMIDNLRPELKDPL
jgi:hypothetical protein